MSQPSLPCCFASASRGSRLALTQAERRGQRAAAGLASSSRSYRSRPSGDRDRTRPFGEIGERGVFVKELEEALLAGRIDVAVHSAKDMTSTDVDGLAVGAYLVREDPRDALCGASELRPGMRVGTASARRRAQLLALEPTLSVEPLRGNIDTRLRKRGERGSRRDRARGVRARPPRSRPTRSALGSTSSGCSPRRARAPSRSRCEPARSSSSPGSTTPRRGAGSRPSGGCVAAIGGGCLAPVAAHHDGTSLTALVADEDGAGSSAEAAPSPSRSAASSPRWRGDAQSWPDRG